MPDGGRTPRFAGRVALVTGGRSGIGRATVRALCAEGALVTSLDVSGVPAQALGEGSEVTCDVRDAAQVERVVGGIAAERGGLDVLVQCAGITRDAVLWKLPLADWQEVLDVNLTGAFHVLRAVVPAMRARGAGAVVNVSSINGERGKFGQANYTASKAGLIALTKTAARELGRFGIRVNAVAPGFVRTPMTDRLPPDAVEEARRQALLDRPTGAEDVAAAILFLASDEARQITGQTLRVDAGQYL